MTHTRKIVMIRMAFYTWLQARFCVGAGVSPKCFGYSSRRSFFEGRSGLFSSFGVCFEGDD